MGPPYRLEFTDTRLRSLYTNVNATVADRDLDSGVRSVGYASSSARSLAGASDFRLNSSEIFESIATRPSLGAAYRTFAGESLPWETGAASQTMLRNFDLMVRNWRSAHPAEPAQGEAMLRQIYSWVTDAGGLGMVVDANASEMTVDEIAANPRGDCTEFTKLYLALLSRAGYTPYPVWVQRDLNGAEAVHVVAGVTLGGASYLLDPVYGQFNPAHQSVSRLSLRELLAWHWNNRAIDIRASAPSTALGLYTRALQVDPQNPHFLTNRGIAYLDNQDVALASADFNAALAAVPNFHQAIFQLGNIEFDAGHYDMASRYFRRAVALSPATVDYRHNLVLALRQMGRISAAERESATLRSLAPDHRI